MATGIEGLIANPAVANIGDSFARGQQIGQQNLLFQQQQQELARANQARDLAGEFIGSQFGGTFGELGKIAPEQFTQMAKAFGIPLDDTSRISTFVNSVKVASLSSDPIAALRKERDRLAEIGMPVTEYDNALDDAATDPDGAVQSIGRVGSLMGKLEEVGMIDPNALLTSGQREFKSQTKGLSPEDELKARRIDLGLEPRAGISAAERIASTPGATETVADSKARIKKAEEKAKLESKMIFEPKIKEAVKLAELAAKDRGESLSDLARSEAALPGLIETIDTLKALAPIATSTFAGKLFDSAARELGFGGTKGATARARFSAIVSNQVLPLLKETFGSAFTAAEGQELKSTMGDLDASPEEKLAQLDAFIEQKKSSIAAKRRSAGANAAATAPAKSGGVLMTDAQGNRAMVFPDGTFEEIP